MIRTLSRLLGGKSLPRSAAPSGPRRPALGLEELGGRTLPSANLLGQGVTPVLAEAHRGSEPSTPASPATRVTIYRGSGEEIPQSR